MNYREPVRSEVLVVAFNSHLFGMNPATGQRIWERTIPTGYPRLYVSTDRVVVLAQTLSCFDLATGSPIWENPAIGDTLLSDGVHVYTGGTGEVFCVLLADGRTLWHDGFKGKGLSPVSLGIPGAVAQLDRNQ